MSSVDQLEAQENQDTSVDTSVIAESLSVFKSGHEAPGFTLDETNHWNTNTNSNRNDNDDFDFDDFGTAVSGTIGMQDGSHGDDGFGDFGEARMAGSGDDDFGDFGQVQLVGDGHGDDEFGDFDFAGGGDAFKDSEDFEGATDGNVFGTPEPASAVTHAQPMAQVEEAPSVELAPDFNAVNSRQVETYVFEKLSALYPIDDLFSNGASPKLLNPELDVLDVASVLSDQDLWTLLCEQSFQGGNSNTPQSPLSKSAPSSVAPQFQWKYSDLRKEYYASLGLTIAKEQSTAAPASQPSSFTNLKSKVTPSMIVNAEAIPERKPLNIDAAREYCRFTKDNLRSYSGDEIKDIVVQLTELTRQASDELTYWLDQREQMTMDSERYNEMIASLVGRAAKLKDAESRQSTKTKRLTRSSFHLK